MPESRWRDRLNINKICVVVAAIVDVQYENMST